MLPNGYVIGISKLTFLKAEILIILSIYSLRVHPNQPQHSSATFQELWSPLSPVHNVASNHVDTILKYMETIDFLPPASLPNFYISLKFLQKPINDYLFLCLCHLSFQSVLNTEAKEILTNCKSE